MPVETFSPSTTPIPVSQYRQTIGPSYYRGTFVGDDTDFHDFRARAQGKGRATVSVDLGVSTANMTVRVYGLQDDTGGVGETGVVQIGGDITILASSGIGYETLNDPFPFYLIRCVSSTQMASSTNAVFFNLHAM